MAADQPIRRDIVRFVACCDALLHSGEMQRPLSEPERELLQQYAARLSDKLALKTTTA